MDNPYNTPGAQELLRPQGPHTGPIWKAVLVGLLVDIIGTEISGGLFAGLYAAYQINHGVSAEQVKAAFDMSNPLSPLYLTMGLIGLAWSFFGGRICCKIAGTNARKSVIITGTLSVMTGLVVGTHNQGLTVNMVFMGVLTFAAYYIAYRVYILSSTRNANTTNP